MALINPNWLKIKNYLTNSYGLLGKFNTKGYIPSSEAMYMDSDGNLLTRNSSALTKAYLNNLTTGELDKSLNNKSKDLFKKGINDINNKWNNENQNEIVSQFGLPKDTRQYTEPTEAGTPEIKNYYDKGNQSIGKTVLLPDIKYNTPTIIDKTNNYVSSLFNPLRKIPSIKYNNSLINPDVIGGNIPLSINPEKITRINPTIDNTINPEDVITEDKNTDAYKGLLDKLVEGSNKSIKEQKIFNTVKTISDALQTGGAMIANATADRPEPIQPSMVIPPTYESVLPEYKNMIDRNMAGSLAAGIKIARETGRPELIPSMIANMQSEQNTNYGKLAEQDIAQRNQQNLAVVDALNKNEASRYAGSLQDAEMMDKINATRSELMAKMGTNLFSTIPNNYMQNKQSLVDMGNKAELYKYLVDSGLSSNDLISAINMITNMAEMQVSQEPKEGTRFSLPDGGKAIYVNGKYYKLNSDGTDYEYDANKQPVQVTF